MSHPCRNVEKLQSRLQIESAYTETCYIVKSGRLVLKCYAVTGVVCVYVASCYTHMGSEDSAVRLTLILLTWTIWRAPTNASKWRMGFNSAFKGLTFESLAVSLRTTRFNIQKFYMALALR